MPILISGLVVFLGAHSVRVFAEGWRQQVIVRLGLNAWKGLYSVVSIIGFGLIVWGFGLARQHPAVLYASPMSLKHLNALFTLIAFVLIVAAYVPRNHLKAAVGHPMLAGVALWALGHLLAIGGLRDVVLFGTFLVWAIADFAVSRGRDHRAGVTHPPGTLVADTLVIAIGVLAWAAFAFWLHARLIGISPFA